MPFTLRNPNTVYLGGGDGPGGEGGYTPVVDMDVIGTPTPGMLAEVRVDTGVLKWAVHSAGGADADVTSVAFFIEQTSLNLGVDDNYVAGSRGHVGIAKIGSTWWVIAPTGQNFTIGALLQSNGDGRFKAVGTGTGIVRALEGTGGALAAPKRIRVEVIRTHT